MNLSWRLWKLANDNLSYTICCHMIHDSFESHTFNSHSLCNQLIDLIVFLLFDRKLTLASLLCKPFQYSLIEFRILRHEASHRLPFRWQFNLAVKKVRLIFPPATDHGLTDAVFSGDFRVIFNSSSVLWRLFKFKREVVRRATSLGHYDNLTWNKRLRTRDCLVSICRLVRPLTSTTQLVLSLIYDNPCDFFRKW